MTSCSFNTLFLAPLKNPKTATSFKWKKGNDSIYLKITGDNFQPTFIKNKKDTINFDFTIESIIIKSKNKNNLNAWFLKPKNSKATITLLHLHGNSGNLFTQYEKIAPLIKNGFQILMFDYSGYGYSEGEADRANIVDDAISSFDYMISREDTKNTKIVIYGQSLGGNLAVKIASLTQKDIDGVVIEAGFKSYKKIANHFAPIVGGIIVRESINAKKLIKKNYKPLLVIHSPEDNVVPFSNAEAIYKNANQPKTFMETRNCHICGPKNYSDEIATKIKVMLNLN